MRPPTARSMARPTAGGSGTSDDLVALAAHAQDAVAVFLAEVGDVGAAGFEDPQAEQPEHGDQGEVVRVGRRRGQRSSIASNCRWDRPRVGDSGGTLGRRTYSAGECVQHPVDDAGAVEAGHHRQPPRHGRGLEPADLLQPAHVQLDVGPGRPAARARVRRTSPGNLQVGLGVGTRQALVAGEVPGHSPTKIIGPFDGDRWRQNFHRGSHALDCAPCGMSECYQTVPGGCRS